MNDDPQIAALRAALELSPDNLPLRRLFADALLKVKRFADAEPQYRELLKRRPDDASLQHGLAEAFFGLGKASQALVAAEQAAKRDDAPSALFLLLARLRFRMGERDAAREAYEKATADDPTLADAELEAVFGASKVPPAPADARSDFEDLARLALEVGDDEDEDVDVSGVVVERPDLSFADVGGMEGLKEEIRLKIVHPLRHPEVYAAYGKKAGGGVLLYGPPGCGKTHLARAAAGEVKASFLVVGIHDVLDMWIGNSEKALHAVFERARRAKPCVVFFDEIDALAASRADVRSGGYRSMVNQFLNEMDGVGPGNEGVLVLGATNAPWQLDDAFRRPGRFDRVLFVPPPDEGARAAILSLMLKGKPVEGVDAAEVARRTKEFSGADLKALVDLAIEAKLRDAVRTGRTPPLTQKDLLRAASEVKPSTREWFATAKNYVMFANQAGRYDDVAKYLKLP